MDERHRSMVHSGGMLELSSSYSCSNRRVHSIMILELRKGGILKLCERLAVDGTTIRVECIGECGVVHHDGIRHHRRVVYDRGGTALHHLHRSELRVALRWDLAWVVVGIGASHRLAVRLRAGFHLAAFLHLLDFVSSTTPKHG